MHTTAATINTIKAEQNARFYERADLIDMLWLCIASGEHGFVVGEPGTAKTALIDDTLRRIQNARVFEMAMSKFRTPESTIGPIDLKVYRESGVMIRKRKGFVQDAHYIFIDEIGRMNPMLGDEMLALYNERCYHEVNGERSKHPAPLLSGFSASNTMLTDNDSDDAQALWDRQLGRTVVEPIKDPGNLVALLMQDPADFANPTTIDLADLEKVIKVEVPAVKFERSIAEAIVELQRKLAADHVYPSTRRLNKSKPFLQASAFLAGRDTVLEEDLAVLRFTLWDTLPQVEKIEKHTMVAANPYADRALTANKLIGEVVAGLAERADKSSPERGEFGKEADPKLQKIRDDLIQLKTEAGGRSVPKYTEIVTALHQAFINMYSTCFDLEPEVIRSAADRKMGALLAESTVPAMVTA